MRVLVDTSVWADFLNDAPSAEVDLLTRLIEDEVEIVTCGPIVAEVFQGIRRTSALPALERQFRDMEWLTPREPESYLAAARLYRELRGLGITLSSTIDCLIVILAEEYDVFLLSRDADLRRIVESGATTARALPGA